LQHAATTEPPKSPEQAEAHGPGSTPEDEESGGDACPPLEPGLQRSRSAMILPELGDAEHWVAELLDEYGKIEEAHMRTLTTWVDEYNKITQDIGRHVIERAQSYYDSKTVWQQAIQEFAKQQELVDMISGELSAAVRNLSKAEAAFESFMTGGDGDLLEEEWAELAPLEEGELDGINLGSDGRLLRTLRVSSLADRVTALQHQRDTTTAELRFRKQELEDARTRSDLADAQHSSCTWNCSVKRAAPFYERRRLHEATVDSQLSDLGKLEKKLQQARQRVASLRAEHGEALAATARTPRQLDEMSLQSFEIAGGEPGQDEFLSCDEDSD